MSRFKVGDRVYFTADGSMFVVTKTVLVVRERKWLRPLYIIGRGPDDTFARWARERELTEVVLINK